MLNIESILNALPTKTIGLVGDLFLDRYFEIDSTLDEPSVETGLAAYQVRGVRNYPGALGTVLNNLAALGVGRIMPITIFGDDGEGYELMQALAAMPAVDSNGIIRTRSRRTPTYTKPMRDGFELHRLDIKNRTPTPDELQTRIIESLKSYAGGFDALLVLDQVSEVDCGVVTSRVRDWICDWAAVPGRPFVLADSRERIGMFRNVAVKPNHAEASRWEEDPVKLSKLVNGPVFLTRSENGIMLAYQNESRMISAYAVHGRIDPCGAGDSCSAAIASACSTGANLADAAAFGNLIASITVQQIGVTGTAPPDAVRRRWREVCSA